MFLKRQSLTQKFISVQSLNFGNLEFLKIRNEQKVADNKEFETETISFLYKF